MGSVVFSTGQVNDQQLMHSFSQEELMDAQWEILVAKSNHPGIVALVRDKIEDISPGSSSHRAGVLKAALKKAFELKKKKRQRPGVLLRCPNIYECVRSYKHVSRSETGTSPFCSCSIPETTFIYYLECSSCGFQRKGNYMTCQGCGVRFL